VDECELKAASGGPGGMIIEYLYPAKTSDSLFSCSREEKNHRKLLAFKVAMMPFCRLFGVN
jgi:hypothetical protein